MENKRAVVTIVVWLVAGASFVFGVAGGTYLGLYGLLLAVGMSAAIFIGAALATRSIWVSRPAAESTTTTSADHN
jgi:hypothetical protein